MASVVYEYGEIVWVKLSNSWWPGEVCDESILPEETLTSLKKSPIAVVKFFNEDSFEYVRNFNCIYKYNCTKKNEFIRKGLELYRSNNKFAEKFPADVQIAETKTGGDKDILDSEEFAPNTSSTRRSATKTMVKMIFGESTSAKNSNETKKKKNTPIKSGFLKGTSTVTIKNLSQSQEKFSPQIINSDLTSKSVTTTPTSGLYKCHLCAFTSLRQNVIIIHSKTHKKLSMSSSLLLSTPEKSPTNKSSSPSVIVIDDDSEGEIRLPKIDPVTTINSILSKSELKTCITLNQTSISPINEDLTNLTVVNEVLNRPVRQPPKKQLSQRLQIQTLENEKRREITNIIAEWSDTEDLETTANESTRKSIECLTKSESNSASNIQPQPKIRNIPKKDRRAIVFDDFNSKDLTSSSNSSTSNENTKEFEDKCATEDNISNSDLDKAASALKDLSENSKNSPEKMENDLYSSDKSTIEKIVENTNKIVEADDITNNLKSNNISKNPEIEKDTKILENIENYYDEIDETTEKFDKILNDSDIKKTTTKSKRARTSEVNKLLDSNNKVQEIEDTTRKSLRRSNKITGGTSDKVSNDVDISPEPIRDVSNEKTIHHFKKSADTTKLLDEMNNKYKTDNSNILNKEFVLKDKKDKFTSNDVNNTIEASKSESDSDKFENSKKPSSSLDEASKFTKYEVTDFADEAKHCNSDIDVVSSSQEVTFTQHNKATGSNDFETEEKSVKVLPLVKNPVSKFEKVLKIKINKTSSRKNNTKIEDVSSIVKKNDDKKSQTEDEKQIEKDLDISVSNKELLQPINSENVIIDSKKTKYSKRVKNLSKTTESFEKKELEPVHENLPIEIKSNIKIIPNEHKFQHNESTKTEEIVPLKNEKPLKSSDTNEAEETSSMRTLRNRGKYSKLFVEIIEDEIESPAMSPLRKSPIRLKSPTGKINKPSPLTKKDKTREIPHTTKTTSEPLEKKSSLSLIKKDSEKLDGNKKIPKDEADNAIKVEGKQIKENSGKSKIIDDLISKNVTDSTHLSKQNPKKKERYKSELNREKRQLLNIDEGISSKSDEMNLSLIETARKLVVEETANKNNSLLIPSDTIAADKNGTTNELSIEIKEHKLEAVEQSFDEKLEHKMEKQSTPVILDAMKTKNDNETTLQTDNNECKVKNTAENKKPNTDESLLVSEVDITPDSTSAVKSCETENVISNNDKNTNMHPIKEKLKEFESVPKMVIKLKGKKTNDKSSAPKENKDTLTAQNSSIISKNFSTEGIKSDNLGAPEKQGNVRNISETPSESAVFDFRDDDEDFEVLTTITELKKKYSPEKSKTSEDFITNPNKTESKTTGEEKSGNDKVDSTKLYLSDNTTGTKIKEKNKRIFKSRNRSNESTTSSTTTIASFITSNESIASPQQNKALLKDFDLITPSSDKKNLEGKEEDSPSIKRRRSHIKITPRKFDQKPSTSNQNMDFSKECIQVETLPEKTTKETNILETNEDLQSNEEINNELKSSITSSETTADIRSFRRSKNLKLSNENQEQIIKDSLQIEGNKFTDDKTDSDIVKAIDQIASLQKSPSVTVAINNSNNQCKLFEKFAIEVKTDVTLGDQISDILYKAPEITTKKRKQTIEEEIATSTSKLDCVRSVQSPTGSTQPARKISKIDRKLEDTCNILNSINTNYNEEIIKTKTPNQSQQLDAFVQITETPAELLTTSTQDNVRLILAAAQVDQTNVSSTTINSQEELVQQQISQLNVQDQLSKKHRGRPKKSLDSPPSQSIATQSNIASQAPAEQYGYDSKGNRLVIIKYGSGSKPVINEKIIIKQQVQPALSPAVNMINSEINIPLDNLPTVSTGDISSSQIVITSKGNVINQSSYTTTRTNSPAPIQENIPQQQITQQAPKTDHKGTRHQQQSQFSRPRKRKIEQTVTSPPPLASISSNETNAAKQQKFINTISKSLTNTLNTATSSSAPQSVPEEEIQSRIMAVPACHFNLPGNAYYLCSHDNDGNYMPIDNQELYLDPETNQLVPASVIQQKQQETAAQNIILTNENDVMCVEVNDQQQTQHQQAENNDISNLLTQQQVVINIDGQQLILDHQDFMALAASNGETQLVTADGQTFIISPEFLQALGICGTSDAVQQQLLQPDNVETSLDNSSLIGDVLQIESTDDALLQHNTQAETNETNAILTQPPIMSTLETPSSSNKKKTNRNKQITPGNDEVLRPQNLDDCIAFIATQSSTVPSSLELPITVTNPNIAPKLSSNNLYNTKALVASTDSQISPNAQLQFTSEQELNELFITSNTCDVQQKVISDDHKTDELVEGHDINDYSNQSSVVSGINFDDPR